MGQKVRHKNKWGKKHKHLSVTIQVKFKVFMANIAKSSPKGGTCNDPEPKTAIDSPIPHIDEGLQDKCF